MKNQKGFRWVKITDDQYQKCIEMSEPSDAVSSIVGWCIDQMVVIPANLPRKYSELKYDDQKKILAILNQELNR